MPLMAEAGVMASGSSQRIGGAPGVRHGVSRLDCMERGQRREQQGEEE